MKCSGVALAILENNYRTCKLAVISSNPLLLVFVPADYCFNLAPLEFGVLSYFFRLAEKDLLCAT